MAKLYFRYGAMGSAKTANLLMTSFNFEEKGFKVLLIKPSIDDRFSVGYIESRIGIKRKCFLLEKNQSILKSVNLNGNNTIVFIDEVQFLSEKQVNELVYIVDNLNINVFCYGLKTDFTGKLFCGSKRLIEVCDNIDEIKSICECGNKALFNARIDELGNVITEGETIKIGSNESYKPLCRKCFIKNLI